MFVYIPSNCIIILMKIRVKDLGKIVHALDTGIAQLSDPSSVKRIVLLVESLDDMIKNAKVVGRLSNMLDSSLNYPVSVKEQQKYLNLRREGDYSINLAELLNYKNLDAGLISAPKNRADDSEE